MLAAIGDAKTCPHGHPIHAGARIEGVPLADVEEGATVTILRFENEAEELLHYLKDDRARAGDEGHADLARRRRGRRRRRTGEACASTAIVAETVSVIADPSPPPRIALPEQLVISKDRYGR